MNHHWGRMIWALSTSSQRRRDAFSSMQFTCLSSNSRYCWAVSLLSIWQKSFAHKTFSSVFDQAELKRASARTLLTAREVLQSISWVEREQDSSMFWFAMCTFLRLDTRSSVSLSECTLCRANQAWFCKETSSDTSVFSEFEDFSRHERQAEALLRSSDRETLLQACQWNQ